MTLRQERAVADALAARHEALNAFTRKWDRRIEGLRAKVEDCAHSQFREYEWESDDGYGRQSRQVGRECLCCGKRCSFPPLPGSNLAGYWTRHDGNSNSD